MSSSKATSSFFGVACRLFLILTFLIIAGVPHKIHPAGIDEPSADWLGRLEFQAGIIWGADNVWLPVPDKLVQYEPDLGERSMVDFKKGKACVEILLEANENPWREAVLAHMKQGVGNLILRKPEDPVEMIKKQDKNTRSPIVIKYGSVELPPGREIRIYTVEKGDSLWLISRRFGMKTDDLCRLNHLSKKETLQVGRPIKVFVYVSHDLTLDSEAGSIPDNPLLLDQIRMVDGRPVNPAMVRDFAGELIDDYPPKVKKVIGSDGIERLVISIDFTLVSNHVEIRARKIYPMVLIQAEKYKVDPAVVMAIIHTESKFNPMARSKTPAYGLMQLVLNGGGLEAYDLIYGRDQKLTAQYLYDPENNIELGTAYYNILKNRYMGAIVEPESRTYCAVAAYNAGASNVGYAFVSEKSINQATPKINQMDTREVYQRLITKLPSRESRNYVRSVFSRAKLYRGWNQ